MVEVHQAEPDQMQRNLRKHFQIEPGNAEAEGLKQEFVVSKSIIDLFSITGAAKGTKSRMQMGQLILFPWCYGDMGVLVNVKL